MSVRQQGCAFYDNFWLSIKLWVNEKNWYQIIRYKFINNANKAEIKCHIHDNYNLD